MFFYGAISLGKAPHTRVTLLRSQMVRPIHVMESTNLAFNKYYQISSKVLWTNSVQCPTLIIRSALQLSTRILAQIIRFRFSLDKPLSKTFWMKIHTNTSCRHGKTISPRNVFFALRVLSWQTQYI